MRTRALKICGLVIILISMLSCDGITGLEGVIIDIQSGERVEGVDIQMKSNYETVDTSSDSNGYFKAIDFYSCGFNCDESFTISFEKDGYELLELNDNFNSDPNTGYIDERSKDTVVVKLTAINNEMNK